MRRDRHRVSVERDLAVDGGLREGEIRAGNDVVENGLAASVGSQHDVLRLFGRTVHEFDTDGQTRGRAAVGRLETAHHDHGRFAQVEIAALGFDVERDAGSGGDQPG